MFVEGKLFLLECKSHKGNTFPLKNLTQFGKLQQYKNIPGLRAGVILWFIDHDVVVYIPIDTILAYVDAGCASVNIKDINSDTFKMYNLSSIKKRTFLTTDYSVLTQV